jgi:uncharacterized protein
MLINEETALQGARDIVAEWINENIYENNCDVVCERKATLPLR